MGTRTTAQMLGIDPSGGFTKLNPTSRGAVVKSAAAVNPATDSRRGGRPPQATFTVIGVETIYTTAAEIQADLDNFGFAKLQSGVIDIDTPIVLRFGMTLRGAGQDATVLNFVGDGSWCVLFGVSGASNYGCYLEDLSMQTGGVLVRAMGQHCSIVNVTARSCRSHGFSFDASTVYIGERLALINCRGTDNQGSGLYAAVGLGGSIHGVDVYSCEFDNNYGYGIHLETVSDNGTLLLFTVEDTVVRHNARGADVSAEFRIHGYCNAVSVVNTAIATRDHKAVTGILVGRRVFGVTRYPGFLYVKDVSIDCGNNIGINPAPRAMDLDYAYVATFEGIDLAQDSAKIYYRSLGPAYVPNNLITDRPTSSKIELY